MGQKEYFKPVQIKVKHIKLASAFSAQIWYDFFPVDKYAPVLLVPLYRVVVSAFCPVDGARKEDVRASAAADLVAHRGS
jgi:hypothetical protein